MADETIAATEGVEQAVLAFVDGIDFVERNGDYRAVVHLGDGDTAIICVLPGGAIEEALKIARGHLTALLQVMRTPDGGMAEAVAGLLSDETFEDLWRLADAVIAQTLVAWNVPEITKIYAIEANSMPNARMGSAARLTLLRRLPVSVTARLLVGAVWLAKNSLRSSRRPK